MPDIRLRDVTPADLGVLFEFGRDPVAVQMAAFTHKDPSDRAAFDAHWGKGLATKALAAFLREETTRPLFGRTAKDNAGSRRVLEKCGFRLASEGRWFANARGAEIDELLLRLD